MARNKNVASEEQRSEASVCGDCEEAYGYCWPVLGGAPYFCRCPLHPYGLLCVSKAACGVFRKRISPRPKVVTERVSPGMETSPAPEKVVPLFRTGERRPWKTVPVSEIPVGGISWDGTPAVKPQEDTEW